MKIYIFILSILLTINLYAKPRAQMIREQLIKLEISDEIIEKTIELDKEVPNFIFDQRDESIQYLEKFTKDIEMLLEKDKKNFILTEDLIDIYSKLKKSDDIKLKNIQLYEKYSSHEVSRLFHSLRAYASIGDKRYNKNYTELKHKYPKHLLTIIAITYTIGMDEIIEIMVNDEETALRTINAIMSDCDNEQKRLESNISEEEAWGYKLSIGTFAINGYLRKGKVQEAIDFYYNNFVKKEPSKNVLEYCRFQNMNIQFYLFQANKKMFEDKDKKIFDENRKKINYI